MREEHADGGSLIIFFAIAYAWAWLVSCQWWYFARHHPGWGLN
jgi:hypothetical protein